MGKAQGWSCGLFGKASGQPGALDLRAGRRDLGLQEGEASRAAEITSFPLLQEQRRPLQPRPITHAGPRGRVSRSPLRTLLPAWKVPDVREITPKGSQPLVPSVTSPAGLESRTLLLDPAAQFGPSRPGFSSSTASLSGEAAALRTGTGPPGSPANHSADVPVRSCRVSFLALKPG